MRRDVPQNAGSGDSLLLFAFTVALLWWVGAPLQRSNIITGLIITEIILVALPPLILAKRFHLNFKKTFRFRSARFTPLIFMATLAGSGFFLITQLQALINKYIGIPQSYIEGSESMLSDLTGIGILGGFLILAVLPAICEEILFRGYILDGLTRKWGIVTGIVLAGILFGAFHLDPYRLVAASLLGIVYGAIVWRQNSIFFGMLGHTINNGLAFAIVVLSERLPHFIPEEDFLPLWLSGIMAILFIVSFSALWRKKDRRISIDGVT